MILFIFKNRFYSNWNWNCTWYWISFSPLIPVKSDQTRWKSDSSMKTPGLLSLLFSTLKPSTLKSLKFIQVQTIRFWARLDSISKVFYNDPKRQIRIILDRIMIDPFYVTDSQFYEITKMNFSSVTAALKTSMHQICKTDVSDNFKMSTDDC